MGFLEEAAADLHAGQVRGDGQHRGARAVGVIEAVHQVQVPGAAGSGAHRQFTCQLRLGTGREGSRLLVSDMDPVNAAIG